MSFTVDDTAPVSGCYKVLSNGGVYAGKLYITAGASFPPPASPTQYYEFEQEENREQS